MLSSFWKDAGTLFYIVPVTESFSKLEDVPDYVGNAIPFFLLLIILETFYGKLRNRNFYCLKDTVMSVSLGIVQVLVGIWIKEFVYIPYSMLYDYFAPVRAIVIPKYFPFLLTLTKEQTTLGFFILSFLGNDLGYYMYHRFAHEWHALWASHSVHHSGERYNFATALRQGSLQQFASWFFYLPLAIIGLPLAEFSRHNRLNTVYQFWIHTELVGRLPWFLELIFNTASHHRLHHKPPGNCNYAGVLIIWDRFFGTFQPECGWPHEKDPISRGVVYGLAKPLNTYDPVYANMQHHFRMSEIKNPSDANSTVVQNVEKFRRYLVMCGKKRVIHPWRIVTSWEEFAPDIIDDWNSGQGWFGRMFELPPDVEVDADKLVKRERDFIKGRIQREGKLSTSSWFTVFAQFVLTLGASLAIILNAKLTQGNEDQRTLYAITCTLCVIVLQSFKLYY